jgi:glucan phosphoethanolaminetransferase (alkaline phosphatase superfamily)
MIIVLEALAGGTFIYVTFLEVLAQERANDHSNLVQLGAIIFGFLVITAIQVYELSTEMFAPFLIIFQFNFPIFSSSSGIPMIFHIPIKMETDQEESHIIFDFLL